MLLSLLAEQLAGDISIRMTSCKEEEEDRERGKERGEPEA
jgi:hypothetical protein